MIKPQSRYGSGQVAEGFNQLWSFRCRQSPETIAMMHGKRVGIVDIDESTGGTVEIKEGKKSLKMSVELWKKGDCKKKNQPNRHPP
jgi:hypothetical protein